MCVGVCFAFGWVHYLVVVVHYLVVVVRLYVTFCVVFPVAVDWDEYAEIRHTRRGTQNISSFDDGESVSDVLY